MMRQPILALMLVVTSCLLAASACDGGRVSLGIGPALEGSGDAGFAAGGSGGSSIGTGGLGAGAGDAPNGGGGVSAGAGGGSASGMAGRSDTIFDRRFTAQAVVTLVKTARLPGEWPRVVEKEE